MDPENQDRIKSLVDEHGADDMVVVLGAADLVSGVFQRHRHHRPDARIVVDEQDPLAICHGCPQG